MTMTNTKTRTKTNTKTKSKYLRDRSYAIFSTKTGGLRISIMTRQPQPPKHPDHPNQIFMNPGNPRNFWEFEKGSSVLPICSELSICLKFLLLLQTRLSFKRQFSLKSLKVGQKSGSTWAAQGLKIHQVLDQMSLSNDLPRESINFRFHPLTYRGNPPIPSTNLRGESVNF